MIFFKKICRKFFHKKKANFFHHTRGLKGQHLGDEPHVKTVRARVIKRRAHIPFWRQAREKKLFMQKDFRCVRVQ